MIWYNDGGENRDYILSTRVRFARNIVDYPFPSHLCPEVAAELILRFEGALGNEYKKISPEELSSAELTALLEKRLISPEFAKSNRRRALFLSEDERVSVMACEEDHLRIQSIVGGFDASKAYELALECEAKLEGSVSFAFDKKLGFLTQCPTNLGTGMRISVMAFLPGLTYFKKMRHISESLSKFGMTIRGVYGEGSESEACIYQISNQVTLGFDESNLCDRLCEAVTAIISQERQCRERMKGIETEDAVMRSLGALCYSRKMTCAEFERHYASIRLGIALGYIDIPWAVCDRAYIEAQPSLIALGSKEKKIQNTPEERDICRSAYLREVFSRR